MISHSSPAVLPQAVFASPTPPGLSPLSVGQTLTGTIHKILPDGQALVHVKGQPLLVALPQPLTPGQRFTATVTQTVPSLVLQLQEEIPQTTISSAQTPGILPPPSGPLTAARLLPYFNARQPFGQVLKTLETLLQANPWLREIAPEVATQLHETLGTLQAPEAAPPTAAHLRTQVERSGLNYEAQVRQALLGPQATPKTLPTTLQSPLLALLQAVRTVAAQDTVPHAPQATVVLPQLARLVEALVQPQTTTPAPVPPLAAPQHSSENLHHTLPVSGSTPQSPPPPVVEPLSTLANFFRDTPWLQALAPNLGSQLEEALLRPSTSPPLDVSSRQLPGERSAAEIAPPALANPQLTTPAPLANLKNPLVALLQAVQSVAAEQTSAPAPQATALLPRLVKAVETFNASLPQPSSPAPGRHSSPPALPLAIPLPAIAAPAASAVPLFSSPLPAADPLDALLTLFRQTPWLQELAPTLLPQLDKALTASSPPPPATALPQTDPEGSGVPSQASAGTAPTGTPQPAPTPLAASQSFAQFATTNQTALPAVTEPLTNLLTLFRQTPLLQDLAPSLPTQLDRALAFLRSSPPSPPEAVSGQTPGGRPYGTIPTSAPAAGTSLSLPAPLLYLKNSLQALVQAVQTVATEQTSGHASQAAALLPRLARAVETFDASLPQPASPPPGRHSVPPALPLTIPLPAIAAPAASAVPRFSSPLPAADPLAALLTLFRQTPWLQDLAPPLPLPLDKAIAPQQPSASPSPDRPEGQIQQEPARAGGASPALAPPSGNPPVARALPYDLKNAFVALLQAVRTVATDQTVPHAPQAAALLPLLENAVATLDTSPPQPTTPATPLQSPITTSLAARLQAALGSLPSFSSRAHLPAQPAVAEPLTALITLFRSAPWLQELAPALLPQLDKALTASSPQPPAAALPQTDSAESAEAEPPPPLLDTATPKQNLKGQLLELLRTLQTVAGDQNSPHATQAAETAPHLDKAIHTIEFQQMLNVASWQQEQSIVVPLVLPWNTPSAGSNLMIQRHPPDSQAGPGGLPAYTLVMTLDVSALGPLRIETRLHGKQVSTTIKAAQPGAADFMLPQVPTLVTALHALGFQAEVGCKVQDASDQRDPLVEQLAHLQRLIPTRLVDVTL